MYSMILAMALNTATELPAQVFVAPNGGSCNGSSMFAPQPIPAPAPTRKSFYPPDADVVLRWNETALNAIRAEGTPPPLAARNLAIVHAAIYDAVNAIRRTHQ